jgi:hypothetical protein
MHPRRQHAQARRVELPDELPLIRHLEEHEPCWGIDEYIEIPHAHGLGRLRDKSRKRHCGYNRSGPEGYQAHAQLLI